MKKLKYTVSLEKLRLSSAEMELVIKDNQKSMFENMLIIALSNKNSNSMSGKDGRVLNRILNKIDETSSDFLLLEESEYDLVKSAFCDENARFQPAQFRIICLYQSNIERAEVLEDGEQRAELKSE